jgi:hypothetical protein
VISVIGALLGTQNGRDVEIVNSFDLVTNAGPGKDLGLGEAVGIEVDPAFLNDRKEQCMVSAHDFPFFVFDISLLIS